MKKEKIIYVDPNRLFRDNEWKPNIGNELPDLPGFIERLKEELWKEFQNPRWGKIKNVRERN